MYIPLISSAFHRCRVSEDLCRLSLLLKSSPPSDHPFVRISISDTGIGSSLEEFLDLKSASNAIAAEKFDGQLCIVTTGISDDVIYRYNVNLREVNSSKIVTQLPSNPKNGAKFSGTEVCLSVSENIHELASEILSFLRKMLILKIPNVAIEVVIEQADVPESRCENVFLAESNTSHFSAPNIERLKFGLEDYVFKHGNDLKQKCDSCFRSCEHLQVGIGTACSAESLGNAGLVMEVVIAMSQLETTSNCIREGSSKTEVLYFKDYTHCCISQSSLNALTSIDWKSYGLNLGKVVDQGGCFLEWENLPPDTFIDIAIHCYQKQVMMPAARHKTRPDRFLTKRAVKLALDDLKYKHSGILLSAHAQKTCSYAPDLARSIAGLILSSNDSDFQGECLSLLGLQSKELVAETVEDCIKEKLISVIEMNDRKSQKSKEAAPLLFGDDCSQDLTFQDDEFEQGEDEFDYMD